jgi:hypothetical protein
MPRWQYEQPHQIANDGQPRFTLFGFPWVLYVAYGHEFERSQFASQQVLASDYTL